jgi:transcriptional regulator with XRE-family HTH domain
MTLNAAKLKVWLSMISYGGNMHWPIASREITPEHLEKLIKGRGLTNAKMAKILGVEGWTVGAWLNGKREISDKYRERIAELVRLPQSADLFLTPPIALLTSRISQVDEIADRPRVIDALVEVTRAAGESLIKFPINSISPPELDAMRKLLSAYDDHSLAQLGQLFNSMLAERLRVRGLEPIDYANECIQRVEKCNSEIQLSHCDNRLDIAFFRSFNEGEELHNNQADIEEEFGPKYGDPVSGYRPIFDPETHECLLDDDDRERALEPIRDQYKELARDEAASLFAGTGFEEDRMNDQWIDENTYMVNYMIELSHPEFRESVRLVMDRQGIK